jgi:hypothetical protein
MRRLGQQERTGNGEHGESERITPKIAKIAKVGSAGFCALRARSAHARARVGGYTTRSSPPPFLGDLGDLVCSSLIGFVRCVRGSVVSSGIALVVSLFATACGLGGGPDAAHETVSTGIAPWRDLGPATVCLGTQAFAPPASPPGGLCLPGAEPEPTACTTDAQCGSRESCVCGACTIAYCAAASDCAAPRVCNFSAHRCDLPCTSGTQCGDVADCIGGVCRGRCATTADCQHGEFCDSNHVCFSDDCASVADCQGLERCEVQRVPRTVLEPAPLFVGGDFVLYLELEGAVWRASSRDGLHFTIDPAAAVIDDARAPSAVVEGGVTYLYFERGDGAELRVATAPDGEHFGASTVVLPGPGVHAPTAVHTATGVACYYERDGAIALATGAREAPLEDRGVVLTPVDVQVGDGTPGTAFWTPVTRVTSPHAVVAGPDGARSIRLWFSALGTESSPADKFGETTPIPPNYSIGFAAAELGDPGALHVWPYGPVADRIEAFLDHHDELGPAVVEASGRFRLYYIDETRLGVLGSGR